MSDTTIVILVSVALAVLAIIYMTVGFSSRRSARFIVVGLGMLLVIAGFGLLGWTQMLINGTRSLIDWFMRTAPTDLILWGAGLSVAGLLAMIFGRLIPVKTRSELRMSRADKELKEMERQRAARRRGNQSAGSTGATQPAPAPRPGADPEITQIMNKHGL